MVEERAEYPWKPRTIGAALSKIRRDAGLDREDVARLARISPATLSRYERDQAAGKIDFRALVRICAVLADEIDFDPDALVLELAEIVRERERGLAEELQDDGDSILAAVDPSNGGLA